MITGSTRIVQVVADPVAQLKTPAALNELCAARGEDAVTVPAHVPADQLEAFLDGVRSNRSVAGLVVTVPHKAAALALCDEIGPNARVAGAVNVVRREPDGSLFGETLDGLGFVAGLRSQGIDPAGKNAIVLGAGGAASAVSAALLDAGVACLDVHNRTESRAAELVDRLRRAFPAHEIAVGLQRSGAADLIVNATSNGMSVEDAPTPLPEDLPTHAVVAEVIMQPEMTLFLQQAAERGLRIQLGKWMLEGQLRLIADTLLPAVDA